MQIQPPLSAAGAANIAAQASNKDAATVAPASTAATATNSTVEKSAQSNSDRDAQGQGDGLADRGSNSQEAEAKEPANETKPQYRPAPNLPGQPPSRLDVMG